jgi:hypothetical protein
MARLGLLQPELLPGGSASPTAASRKKELQEKENVR